MKLYRQTVEDFRMYPGMELEEAQMEALEDVLPIVWNDHGKKADGLLDITGYGDDNPDNDKPIYNPATN